MVRLEWMIFRALFFVVFLWFLGFATGAGVFVVKNKSEGVLASKKKEGVWPAEIYAVHSSAVNSFSASGIVDAFNTSSVSVVDETSLKKTGEASKKIESSRAEALDGAKSEQEKVFLDVSAEKAEQGDTLIFKIATSSKASLLVNGKSVPLAVFNSSSVGIYGVDVRSVLGIIPVKLIIGGRVIQEKNIEIRKRDWMVTEFTLSEGQKQLGYTPETAKQAINNDDNAILYGIFGKPGSVVYFDGPFAYPLSQEAEIVGAFGNIRKSGATEIRHLGTDLDAARGTPVYATQNGIARLARGLSNFGNTVVLDHGNSIFSLYLHMDKISVTDGKLVKKGEEVGTVGNTGEYSLGHHLHFSIKLNGASVDPLRFLKQSKDI